MASEFKNARALGEERYKQHESKLNDEEKRIVKLLSDNDQIHLLSYWSNPDADEQKKKSFLQEVKKIDEQINITDYVRRAKKLLSESKEGVNPYDDYIPHIPTGESFTTRTAEGLKKFDRFEQIGMEKEIGATAFVLVAGGLGERLDYPGIKVALPSDITANECFLSSYVLNILALQSRARHMHKDSSLIIPLAIMTSGDTDAATRKLLDENKNFGMEKDQLSIIMQEKVPALNDNDAHFVVNPQSPYSLITKPHGHGDVHTLLYKSGLAEKWANNKKRWIVFFQDTNGLVFHAIPAALGVSSERKMAVNSLTVPRKPGEAVGAIMQLEKKQESKDAPKQFLTINVEYNQLELLVKKEPLDSDGYSMYPGNINVLIFEAKQYLENLKKTGGIIGEFVNPKYKDSTKTVFKKDTRLECMMQDYPKLLMGTDAVVGFTQFERWLCFSAVKNSLADALAKQNQNIAPECASSGEADIYRYYRKVLKERCGVNISIEGDEVIFSGIKCNVGARVVLYPSVGISQAELISKFVGESKIQISKNSTLIINGPNVVIKSLKLDGTLVIHAAPDAHVVVEDLNVSNKGWQFVPVEPGQQIEPKFAIRGYTLNKAEALEVSYDQGNFVLSDKTIPRR